MYLDLVGATKNMKLLLRIACTSPTILFVREHEVKAADALSHNLRFVTPYGSKKMPDASSAAGRHLGCTCFDPCVFAAAHWRERVCRFEEEQCASHGPWACSSNVIDDDCCRSR